MHSVTVSAHYRFSPERAWELVGDPYALADWHPGIIALVRDNDVRICTIQDGVQIHERIEHVDPEARVYRYSIVGGPLPFTGYSSTLAVREAPDGGAIIEWSSTFDVVGAPAGDVVASVRTVYTAGLDALRARA